MIRLESLTVADDPETWGSLGFAVDGRNVRIGATTIVCAGAAAGKGIIEWTLDTPDPVAVEGLAGSASAGPSASSSSPGASSSAAPGDHVNGVVAIDHLVVSTPDLERTVAAIEGLGLECRRRREGLAYGSERMRQAFFWLGDPDGPLEQKVILELVGPETPDPAKAGDPARFFGLALTVRSLDSTAAFFGDLMKPPVEAVQAGRRIATISSRGGSSVAIALMSPH